MIPNSEYEFHHLPQRFVDTMLSGSATKVTEFFRTNAVPEMQFVLDYDGEYNDALLWPEISLLFCFPQATRIHTARTTER